MKKVIHILSILALFLIAAGNAAAQCPMCRMTAESNMKNGGTAGAGLNAGILYMLVVPYLIVGGVAYWWWKNKKKTDEGDGAEEWLNPGENDSVWN